MTEEDRVKLDKQRHAALLEAFSKTHTGMDSVRDEVVSTREEVGELKTGFADFRTDFALHVQKNEHDQDGNEDRLSSLEQDAEATGKHKIVKLETELAETKMGAKAVVEKWKGRAWSVFAALLLATMTAFAGAYFGH